MVDGSEAVLLSAPSIDPTTLGDSPFRNTYGLIADLHGVTVDPRLATFFGVDPATTRLDAEFHLGFSALPGQTSPDFVSIGFTYNFLVAVSPAAVPEPSSLAMVALASVVGLGWSGRRRRTA